MKVIHYGQDQLVTGDAIAAALVRYAQELAGVSQAATVDIPIRNERGAVVMASVLLGPASQIVALPIDTGFEELIDDDVVRDLTNKIALTGPPTALPTTEESTAPAIDLNDW